MPLEPKHEYSAKIYAELICAIGSKLIEFSGEKTAIDCFHEVTKPIGIRDSKLLMPLLGVKPGNAASAALLKHVAARILDINITLLKLDPHDSELKMETCPYGEVVLRHKNPTICQACMGYDLGMGEVLGVKLVRGDRTISKGSSSCFASLLCMDPTNDSIPSSARVAFVKKMVGILTNKNELLVSTLASIVLGLSDKCALNMTPKNLQIAAGNTYEAGAYQGPVFAGKLGLKGEKTDAARLVSEVRETTDCKTTTYHTAEGFMMSTKNCPLKTKCSPGSFIETACVQYTRGLLSKYGNYAVKTDATTAVCRQEFMQTSPKTEGDKNAA